MNSISDNDLHWLAGWLEGEGSFMKGSPSAPSQVKVKAEITDEDVVQKASIILGVSYAKVNRITKPHYKPTWTIMVRGSNAIELMHLLRPLMSKRRQQQIDDAIKSYDDLIKQRQENDPIVTHQSAVLEMLSNGTDLKRIAEHRNISPYFVSKIVDQNSAKKIRHCRVCQTTDNLMSNRNYCILHWNEHQTSKMKERRLLYGRDDR